ncbi:MAG: M12 family metallopeptidase [Hoeflea sp.]|uniref:M12 family metallopeptidase n=1 Tax=Hoeflea sp. TaxID=1940281 RepID=UPI0032EFFA8D
MTRIFPSRTLIVLALLLSAPIAEARAQAGNSDRAALIGEGETYRIISYDPDPGQCIIMRGDEPARCVSEELQRESAQNLLELARMVNPEEMLHGALRDWISQAPGDGTAVEPETGVYFLQESGQFTIVRYPKTADGDVFLDGDILLGKSEALQQFNADLLASTAARLSPGQLDDEALARWIADANLVPLPSSEKAALGDGVKKWNNNCIPVLLTPDLSASSRSRIEAAADLWNESVATLRVVLSHEPSKKCPNNPVVEPKWSIDENCNASASLGPGALIPNQSHNYAEWSHPILKLSSNCPAGTILHEFFHLAGFMHEHQRTGLEGFLTKNATNDMNLATFKTVKLTDYDPCSISHYSPTDNNNKPRFTVTAAGKERATACAKQFSGTVAIPGQRERLSILDVWAINELY